MTSPFHTREGRKFWMTKRPREMICDLILAMNEIYDEAISLNLYARFAFLQEMGCNLIRYNRIQRPDINYNLGVRTPLGSRQHL